MQGVEKRLQKTPENKKPVTDSEINKYIGSLKQKQHLLHMNIQKIKGLLKIQKVIEIKISIFIPGELGH